MLCTSVIHLELSQNIVPVEAVCIGTEKEPVMHSKGRSYTGIGVLVYHSFSFQINRVALCFTDITLNH